MLRIGRYGIDVGRTTWVQTRAPARVWRFLFFWFFKEARPWDTDKKRQFPAGTLMRYEGRAYHYYKAGEDLNVHQAVAEQEKKEET